MNAGTEAAERLEAGGRRRFVAALREFAVWEASRLPGVAHPESTSVTVLVQALDSPLPKGVRHPARGG